LESFVEGFHDENTQVQLQLLTAVVKLFLKRPNVAQALVQRVLSLATQDSDNPDLRDRGFIYWRLLSADPAAAKNVVLTEKPLISEETDLLEPSLLEQLVCHIGTLASVYHKPPSSFIDPAKAPLRQINPVPAAKFGANLLDTSSSSPRNGAAAPTVIPSQDQVIADLLSLDLNAPQSTNPAPGAFGGVATASASMGGLDDLLGLGGDALSAPAPVPSQNPFDALGLGLTSSAPPAQPASIGGLAEIFGSGGFAQPTGLTFPKELWLDASRAMGMQVEGTFTRRGGKIYMEMTITNNAMQAISGFAVQFNRNSFGLVPAEQPNPAPLLPNQSQTYSVLCETTGPAAVRPRRMYGTAAVKIEKSRRFE
uniref:Alpha_adaptinC2 domain-containing protein n=1 Tax=Caenorhabditis japonica TaxID=281687 RepID=A0A8R1IY03_CAEJA